MALVDPSLPKVYQEKTQSGQVNFVPTTPTAKKRFLFSELKTSVFVTWILQLVFFGLLWLAVGKFGREVDLGQFAQVGIAAGMVHFIFAFVVLVPLIISLFKTGNVAVKTKNPDVTMFTILIFPLLTFLVSPGMFLMFFLLSS